jgi:hypothetical protein
MIAETEAKPRYGLASIARDARKTQEVFGKSHPGALSRREIALAYLAYKGASVGLFVRSFAEANLKQIINSKSEPSQTQIQNDVPSLTPSVALEQGAQSVVQSIPSEKKRILPRFIPILRR